MTNAMNQMQKSGTLLIVFAKYWEPGNVKTRLAADIGKVNAAKLYQCFVQTILKRMEGVAQNSILCFSPPEKEAAFQAAIPESWKLLPQSSGNLGERMQACFDSAFENGHERVVLIGSDSPQLTPQEMQKAFYALEKNEVVLGPSPDGGYYLIGAEKRTPHVFSDVEWSSERVLEQTLERLQASGHSENNGYKLLPVRDDIDTLMDLKQLQADLKNLCSQKVNINDQEVFDQQLLDFITTAMEN